jgi:hypothetical protein
MGVVYSALDRQHDQVVALKLLPNVDPEGLYYFKNEFRGLAEIVHPNLVALYELLTISGHWFFTMELIDGVDFVSDIRGGNRLATGPRPPLPPTTSIQSFEETSKEARISAPRWPLVAELDYALLRNRHRQLADGVIALHGHGILHRDLKPSNVIVDRGGRVVILDFGLTTHLADTRSDSAAVSPSDLPRAMSDTTDRTGVGTVSYMSPEQAAGETLSEACDWYSFGVMLFASLTGQLPFVGEWADIRRNQRAEQPPDPRRLNADVPDDLRKLCMDLLQREPTQRPGGKQIRACLAAANLPELRAETTDHAEIPFVGRGKLLRALHQAYEDVHGGAVIMHVSGPSGAGKSRLVKQFLGSLPPADETVVLTGRCYEAESVPYKAVDTVVDSLSRFLRKLPTAQAAALLPRDVAALARVFPVLQRVEAVAAQARPDVADPQELRGRAFAALRQLMASLGERYRLVVAIDDVQWGDVDSAAVLSEITCPPNPPRLLLIVVYRSEHAGTSECLQMLNATHADGGARREVVVGALTGEESSLLAGRLLGGRGLAREHAHLIARQSDGSPFFIQAMVEHVRIGGNVGELTPGAEALDLDRVLRERITQLPPPTRRLLEVIAVAGRPVDQRTALEAASLRPMDRSRLALLRNGHLVLTLGAGPEDAVGIYHDRIRESVVAQLSAESLMAYHGSLAATLERSQQADAEQIAVHYHGAGQKQRAARYYAQAADQASAKLAFDRAARLYGVAIELLPMTAEEKHAMQARQGDALANAGRGAEAALLFQAAAQCADRGTSLERKCKAAYQFCISGHLDQGRAALAAVLQEVGMRLPRTPQTALASLLWNRARLWWRGVLFRQRSEAEIERGLLRRIDVAWTASAGLSMFDVVAGADFQARGCLLALQAGEPQRVARALAWEAAHLSNLGGTTWDKTQCLLKQARKLGETVADPYALGWTDLCEGLTNFTNGRWQAARTKLEQAAGTLRDHCTGVSWELGTAHAFTLWSLLYSGDLVEMCRRSFRLVAEARERGDRYAATTHSAFCLPLAQLVAGDPAQARQTIAAALSEWSRVGFHVQHIVGLMCHTYVDLYCDRGEDAWRRINELWPAVVRSQLLRVQVLRSLLTHLRARSALAAARTSRSQAPLLGAARRDARRLLGENMPYCTPHARHLLAGIAIREGRREQAIELLRDTLRGYSETGMRLFAAATQRRLGEVLGGDEGDTHISEANAYLQMLEVANIDKVVDAFAVAVN